MDLSGVVQWWEQQQLRALVLGSLAVQYFLAFFAGRRKSRIPPWYRFFIWLSYLASDAMAIYALATLFNRQKKLQYRSRDLQVLWAPILLMHLGGQVVITAYNIEDNELWSRHIVIAISQVTVAIYVFCKSWPSSADKKLLGAAVCIFIPGIAKCFQKPFTLMKASFSSLDSFFNPKDIVDEGGKVLEAYVQKARAAMLLKDPGRANHEIGLYLPHTLLLDFAECYDTRLGRLENFCPFGDEEAHMSLNYALSNIFDLLYTKDPATKKNMFVSAYLIMLVTLAFLISAIVLFHKSHNKAYNHSDVNVTFASLYGTLLLELISIFGLELFEGKWSDMVSQHNLIGFSLWNKRHKTFISFARCISCEGFVNKIFCMESCDSSKDITKVVRQHIEEGWEEYITDVQSYKEFNDIRGQWTLGREGCDGNLGWSLEMPFDESVLLWHLATDFCFYGTITSPHHDECARQCREISNYMIHLLCDNPEMLLPGSRKHLVKIACDQLHDNLTGHEMKLLDEEEFVHKLIGGVWTPEVPKGSLIRDARNLYSWLIHLKDEKKMWRVIQGVWVEMLCFSAGRCRGYLHAKSIGTGGEYVSSIWLLLHSTGMETFQHRLQRTQKLRLLSKNSKNQGEDATAPSNHQGMNPSTEGGTSAGGPQTSQGPGDPQYEGTSTYQVMDHPTQQGGNYSGPWSSQYSEGVATYQGMNAPTHGGTFAEPCPSEHYQGMNLPPRGGNFGGHHWPYQYYQGTSNYPVMYPPSQGGNLAGPWPAQYCQGNSTYQGMNPPTEERNATGPCFQM